VNVAISKRNKELAVKYKIPCTPSMVLLDHDGEIIVPLYGYFPKDQVLKWLKTATAFSKNVAALKEKTDDAAKLRALGELFAQVGYDGKAVEYFEKALQANDKRPASDESKKFKGETLALKGVSHYRNNDAPEKVAEIYKALLELDPDGKFGVRDNGLFLKALHGSGGVAGIDVLATVDEAMKKYPASDVMDGLLYIKAFYLWHDKGDKETPKKLFKEILDKYPDSMFRLGAEDALKELNR
jgi:tetratricopeptide (TPR) repeat protein